MMKKAILSTVFFVFTLLSVIAQKNWSLEQCITYARQNSLSMKQAEVGIENTRLGEKASRMERLPNLNATVTGGYNFGRTIDPITNTFRSQSIGTNGISLGANMILYNGGRIHNSIRQSQLDVSAQKAEAEDMANTISLNVAAAYINILFAQEQLANAQKRLELSREQLKQTDRLIQVGSLPENDRLQILAQIAQDEQIVVTQENNVTISYLNLKNLLLLEPEEDFSIVIPDNIAMPAEADPDLYNFKAVYSQALQTQPIIRAGDYRMRSAELDVDIAKSGMLPSLGIFGNIRSDYANQVLDFANPNTDNVMTVLGDEQLANVAGQDVVVQFYELTGFEFPKRRYFDQINDNFGQSVGVSLNIPIYNRHQNQINIERARLNIINTEVVNEQNKQTLKANVQRSIADAKAAKKQYEATQKSVDALDVAYQNTNKRFELGASNIFELTTAKNQLDLAKVDLTIAKFDYLYKLKIVDFYQGKKITLQE